MVTVSCVCAFRDAIPATSHFAVPETFQRFGLFCSVSCARIFLVNFLSECTRHRARGRGSAEMRGWDAQVDRRASWWLVVDDKLR